VQSLSLLKQVTLDASSDGGLLEIDLAGVGLSEADLKRVTVSASYFLDAVAATDSTPSVPVAAVTTPFSDTLGGFVIPSTPIQVAASRLADGLGLTWSGGQPPYTVQVRDTLIAPWRDLLTTSATTASIPMTNGAAFFRIGGR